MIPSDPPRSSQDSPALPDVPASQSLTILSDGGASFSSLQETVIERRPSSSMPRLAVFAILAVALIIAALFVAWVRNDDEPEAAAPATTTTTEPAATTTTTAPRPPRTTLPPPAALEGSIGALPPVRPAAEIVGTLAGDPSSNVAGELFQLNLVTGAARAISLPGPPHTLFGLDGAIAVGIGREVVRVDPDSGNTVLIAEGVSEVLPAYGPSGIVAVARGSEHLFARVVGTDGVFRSAVQIPNEAVVHGALGDHVVVSMAGRIMALDGRNNSLNLGAGRVLAVGDSRVVILQCEEYGCQITDTSFSATVGAERRDDWCDEICAEASKRFGPRDDQADMIQDCATVCDSYPLATGAISRRRVELPAELRAAPAQRWSEQGLISPDGNRVALRLAYGTSVQSGVVVVDLSEDWSRHSPEIGIDLGHMAWAPDSRFLLYTFEDDVMVWDVEAAEGESPSGRAHIGEPLGPIILRDISGSQ